MTNEEYDKDLELHIENVRHYLMNVLTEVVKRGNNHDLSKRHEPERSRFMEVLPKLKGLTYGSAEYKENTAKLGDVLKHHYANNRHHPEHFIVYECVACNRRYFDTHPDYCWGCGEKEFDFEYDVNRMNLIDIIEMVCDWLAAVKRHADGDIQKSIEINKQRFNLTPQLTAIIQNTVAFLEGNGGVE